MNRGSIIVFKGQGLVYEILSRLLKLFEPQWDRWGWHVAIAWEKVFGGWHVLEATKVGVKISFYDSVFLKTKAKGYTWLDKEPPYLEMDKFLQSVVGKKYDVAIYFWSALAIIIRHFFNHPIPKLLDDRFDCWELGAEFLADMGKPIVSKYDTIIISDLVKALESKED